MDYLISLSRQFAEQEHTPIAFPVKNRIAYVVSHGRSYTSNGYAIRTQGIAQALNEHGFETLCFVRPGYPWELQAGNTVPVHHVVNGVRYIHTNWLDARKPADEKEHLEASVKAFVQLFRVFKPQSVLADSDYKISLPAWIAAKRMGLPFYNEVREFAELLHASREPSFAQTQEYKARAERDAFVAAQAERVFTLNQPMKDELARRGIDKEKITIVPHGVSRLPELKAADPALKRKLGIQDGEKVVGYIGSFNPYEGLDILINACAELVRQGEKIKLLLVGDNQPVTSLNGDKTGLKAKPWIIQVGRVPHEAVADYYALIDAVVIPRKKQPVCELVPPLKAAEALAYGKRLVVSDVAPLAEYAQKHDGVLMFEAGRVESLAGRLKRALGMPALRAATSLLMQVPVMPLAKGSQGKCTNGALAMPLKPVESSKPSAQFITVSANECTRIEPETLTLCGNSKRIIANFKVPMPGATLELSASVVYRLKSTATTRKAVLLFDFIDKAGNKKSTIPGIGVAAAFKQHFRYLNENSKTVKGDVQEVFKFKLPEDITSISLAVASIGINGNDHIDIHLQGRCYSEELEKERKRQLLMRQPLPDAKVHDPGRKRYTSDLTVACVLDEFTAECLSHEVNLVKVTQENWQAQMEQIPPDFLLVESCWKGNDDNWGALTKGSGGGKKLGELLRYCKQHSIPTVFWNKEDPPHYDKFGPIAVFFDLAITTDVNMVPKYKKDFGIEAHPLSFGAQPKVHNPKPVISRSDKAVFAGSYYGDKPQRCADFNEIMRQVELAGISYDIYDRNYQKGIAKFAFPGRYQANIVGYLRPDEVSKAHKGYKYQVNMNSVQDSATMFARRVYESLASGTPVISNDSAGVHELFGDIVIMASSQESIAERLKELEASPAAYFDLARRGVRAVMREHTYGHRIQKICQLLGLDVEVDLPSATLAFTATCKADIQRAKELFDAQTAQRKHLFIGLENFDNAYQFLNESSESITYAMQLAHDFYPDERKFYGSDRVLKCSVNDSLPAEALEDFIYWGGMNA